MDGFSPSQEEIDEAAAEFKAVFGPSHTLEIIHDEGAQFLIRSTADGDSSRTALNTIEPPVTRAAFEYAGALACEEYAQLHDECSLRWTKIESVECNVDGSQGICSSCNEALTRHLWATIIHTSAMTAHADADDYVRFEHAKYAHLHRSRFPDVVRGVSLLSRAYIGSAATRYGVRVDLGEITAGMRLGKADRRVIRAARRVLNNVHAQRMRGTRVDVVEHTRALDGALARLKTQYAGG